MWKGCVEIVCTNALKELGGDCYLKHSHRIQPSSSWNGRDALVLARRREEGGILGEETNQGESSGIHSEGPTQIYDCYTVAVIIGASGVVYPVSHQVHWGTPCHAKTRVSKCAPRGGIEPRRCRKRACWISRRKDGKNREKGDRTW